VIFLAEADEEAGGRYGISWLVENHWEKIRAEFAINEGGDTTLSDGRIVVACQCAEKGAGWYRIRFNGRGGHASAPHSENPIYRVAEAVRAIREHTFPARRSAAVESYFRGLVSAGLLPHDLSVDELFDTPPENASVAARAVLSDHWMNAMLRNTITPTALEAGTQQNVIPAHADLTVDTRRLPGVRRDEMIQALWGLVGREDAELTIIEDSDANSSPLGTDLWRAIEAALQSKARSAILAPYLSTGGTDSGALRERGVVCYGLEPSLAAPGELDRIHSHDERIRLESLWWGTEFLFDTVESVGAR
jgi:acetylornithine deacetylase/succinyl-diaminopimelate desuccinylase-like protein